MKPETRIKLLTAWQYCDNEDKSTEFMIQYMQDFAHVSFDTVINFLEKTSDLERTMFIKTLNKTKVK